MRPPRSSIDDLSRSSSARSRESSQAQGRGGRSRGAEDLSWRCPADRSRRRSFPCSPALAVDWTRIDIFWIDERAVPPDHPDSNYALASRLLLVPARVPRRAHPSHARRAPRSRAGRAARGRRAEVGRRRSAAPRSRARRRRRRRPRRVDISDGVSGARRVERRTSSPVIAVYDAPKPPPRRLTMTLPVLADAGRRHRRRIRRVESRGDARRARGDASATPVGELLRARLRRWCCSIAKPRIIIGAYFSLEESRMRTCLLTFTVAVALASCGGSPEPAQQPAPAHRPLPPAARRPSRRR